MPCEALKLAQETWLNGDTSAFSYDAYGRDSGGYLPAGAQVKVVHSVSQAYRKQTVNGRWTKQSYDGLGRVMKVEAGDGTETKSVTDTEYGACACSPRGKGRRVARPHVVDGPVYWTTYNYDGADEVGDRGSMPAIR